MNTTKLYQSDPYIKTFSSRIQQLDFDGENTRIVLEETAFFPVGGGQSCDLGTINNLQVSSVFEEEGILYHQVPGRVTLNPGDLVSCHLDWPRRFQNMQRHCGEHILSGMFFKAYGGVNRGFHMGEDYMTIDISLEENPDFNAITWEMALHVERLANQAIWENLPVITRHYENQSLAAQLPLRKALTIDQDITVVCVGSVENPADCVACCGTHPKNAGEVGLIKILKVESNKGMFRVYFKAGEEAFQDYQEKHEIITSLNNKYSASTVDLLEKIAVQDEKNKAFRNQLNTYKQLILKERTLETDAALTGSKELVAMNFEALRVEELLQIGRAVSSPIPKLLLLISPEESTVLFFSNGKTVDCGKLVNETASIYNGKGGGNEKQARAIFPKAENIPTYIDLIEKHLR